MIRAVLDTNVWVSGLGWRDSPPGQILDLLAQGRFLGVTSSSLLDELERVLAYPKLAEVVPEPEIGRSLVASVCIVVEPTEELDVVRDPDDNRVLEAAVAGAAGFVVSGNHHLLELGSFEGIETLTPRSFLRQLSLEE